MGSGKTSTSTSSVAIPQDVLNRYSGANSVAAKAAGVTYGTTTDSAGNTVPDYSNVTGTGSYQPYSGEFVAPVNSTQQAGIDQTGNYANSAQPSISAGQQQIGGAASNANNYYEQAANTAQQSYGNALTQYGAAQGQYQSGYNNALGYNSGANDLYSGAQSAGMLGNLQGAALTNAGLNSAQPFNATAASIYRNAPTTAGLNAVGGMIGNAAADTSGLSAAASALGGISGGAGGANVSGDYGTAYNYAAQAGQNANPAFQQGAALTQAGLGAAQPMNTQAANYLGGGTRNVDPTQFSQGQVQQYEDPYLQQVLGSTLDVMNQRNAQQRSAMQGSAIGQGAFGGDRAGIAQANLAGQQNLADYQTISGILSNAYGQGLGAFQQQQGVNLGAQQANRAAQQYGSQQSAALGQQVFGQNLAAGQQIAGIGAQAGQLGLGQAGVAGQLSGQQVQAGIGAGQIGAQNASISSNASIAKAAQTAALQQQQFSQQLNAANSLANILSTQFGQNMSQGQALQGLGAANYSQMLGAGQQLAGLGNQSFAQQQAGGTALQGLGNQVYTQGMGLGQAYQGIGSATGALGAQQAGLLNQTGQDIASTGLNAGNAIAGLGVQGQTAGLQGAQAQLQAGAVPQQTQQAIDSAKYNQYLQQQGYPFQVAQFLANIAMGTGSLSGSTTTTTQPAPFFSDERLKENIEPVGKTFDDQPIYKYNYKGEPGTQIGLMAQDVEKHHPGAVGESHGFKTVDYDQATKDAAHRGHFADGGDVYDPSQGPYGQGLGSVGRHKGYVPGATLPIGQLMIAKPVSGPQKSAVAQALGAANDVSGAGKAVSGIYDAGKSGLSWLENHNNPTDTMPNFAYSELGSYANGGRIGYAMGGDLPYDINDQGNGEYFPDKILEDQRRLQALKAASGPNQTPHSGLQDITDIAKLGSSVASIGSSIMDFLPSIFLKNGGRVGYDDGGAIDDYSPDADLPAPDAQDASLSTPELDALWARHIKQESGGRQFGADGTPLTSPAGAVGVAQVMPGTAPEAAKLAGVAFDPDRYRNDPEYNNALGKAYLKAQLDKYGDPKLASAAYNAGPGRVDQAIAKARQTGGSPLTYLPEETQNYVGQIYAKNDKGLAAGAEPKAEYRSGLGTASSANDNQDSGLLGGITKLASGGEKFWIPLLSGLGAMASSNSPYLGAAMLQGLGGGAQAYQGLKKQDADIALRQAQVQKEQLGMALQLRQINSGRQMAGLPPITMKEMMNGQTNEPDLSSPQRQAPSPSSSLVAPSVARIAQTGSAAQAPSPAAVPAATPQTPPVNSDFWQGVDPSDNPAELERRSRIALTNGDQAGADKWQTMRSTILQRGYVMKNGQAVPLPGFAEQKADLAAAEAGAKVPSAIQQSAGTKNMEIQQSVKSKTFDDAKTALAMESQARTMMDLMFDPKTGQPVINSGVAGPVMTKMAALMQQFGASPQLVETMTHTDPSNAQSLEKLRTVLGTEEGRSEMGTVLRQQEFNRFLQSTPGDTMLPNAFKFIIEKVIMPHAKQQKDTWERIADLNPAKDNIQNEVYKFQKENPFYTPAQRSEGAPSGPPTPTAQDQLQQAIQELNRRRALKQQGSQ